jgi:hypothetical protein
LCHQQDHATGLVAHRLDPLAEAHGLGLIEPRRRLEQQQHLRRVDDRPRARPCAIPIGSDPAAPCGWPSGHSAPAPPTRADPFTRTARREEDEVGDKPTTSAVPLERSKDVVFDRQPPEQLHALERAS